MKQLFKTFFIFLLALIIVLPVSAQRWKLLRYEAIVGLGTCNVFGNVGGSADENNLYGIKDIRITETRPALFLSARYKYQENMAFKLNLDFAYGQGSDAGSKNAYRGYSYSSMLFEHSVQYEYYFIHEDAPRRSSASYTRRGMLNNYSRVSAYAFGGLVGLLYFPSLKGNLYLPDREKKVGTGYTVIIPIGIGLKYVFSDQWIFGAEFGGRYAFTKSLQGLNTIYSKGNDIYYLFSVTACYRIKTNRNGYPEFLRRWFLPKPGRRF
jgi:hypothetical protein